MRRFPKITAPAPPNLEDPEAWPSPDVAAAADKEDRARFGTSPVKEMKSSNKANGVKSEGAF